MVTNHSLALGTTCLCGLTCSNQRHDAFEIKVFHFRPRDSGPRRSRTIQCMSSCREFILLQSQKISPRNLERFRICAHLTALGGKFTPPFIRWGLTFGLPRGVMTPPRSVSRIFFSLITLDHVFMHSCSPPHLLQNQQLVEKWSPASISYKRYTKITQGGVIWPPP